MKCYPRATLLLDTARFCLACRADLSGGSGAERTQPVGFDAELMAKLQEEIGGEYLVERELGCGGMAAVYLATDVRLRRKVAVKVLPRDLTFSGGPHIVERFKCQPRTAVTLDRPQLISIHRVSTSGARSTRRSTKTPSARAPREAPVGAWPNEALVRTRVVRTVR